MCEIILVYLMCRKIGDMVGNKGYGPILFQVLLVVAWIVGELLGLMVGFVLTETRGSGRSSTAWPQVVFCAYASAFLAISPVFLVAAVLPEKKSERDFMGDYYKFRHKDRKKKHYEDEDDRPRRRGEDYDDSDRPRRHRDEYDDSDRPRRRDDRIRRDDDYDNRDRPRRHDDRY